MIHCNFRWPNVANMHIVHQSQLEIVERLSGVIARSIIPANLVFGPYDGVLSISSKTMDRKELDYILEVRSSSVWPFTINLYVSMS